MKKMVVSSGELKKAVAFFVNLTSKDEGAFNMFYFSYGSQGITVHFNEHSTYSHIRLGDYDGTGEGVLAFNIYMMNQIVSRLGDGELTIEWEDGKNLITLTYGSAQWTIGRLDESLIEPIFTPDVVGAVEVTGEDFATTIGQVGPASEPKMPTVFQGINLVLHDRVLTLQATDRYLMVRHRLPVESDGEFNVVVRAKMLMSFARLIDKDSPVRLLVDGGFLWAFVDDTVVRFACMAGEYPSLDGLFARELTPVGTYKVADFIEQVSLCQSVCDKSEKVAPLTCSFNGDKVVFRSHGVYGQTQATCANVAPPEKPVEICVSSRFLYSYLKLLKDETITLSCFDDMTLYLGGGDKCAGLQKAVALQ